jgi:hypothetical protein
MKLRIWISAITASIILVLLTASIQAHHSIPAYYDESKTISVVGVVKQVRIMNPHSSILIEGGPATGPKGVWLAVMASGSALARNGWTNDTIKAGSTVTIEGNPARAAGKGVDRQVRHHGGRQSDQAGSSRLRVQAPRSLCRSG